MAEHVHWKKLTNPDYIGAYAFDKGEEKTATIRDVRREMVVGADGKKEECTVMYFKEADLKPLILNHTNAKTITKLYGTGFIDEWVGKKVTMVVKSVRAFGETVDAVRIKNEVPRAKPSGPILCEDCGKAIKAIGTYSAEDVARINKNRFGACICGECSKKRSEAKSTAPERKENGDAEPSATDATGTDDTARRLAEAMGV